MLQLFGSVIDLSVFAPSIKAATGTEVLLKMSPPTVDASLVLVPSGQDVSAEESIDLFRFLFTYMGKCSEEMFQFWFEQCKRSYFSLLYPTVFKKLGVLDAKEGEGGDVWDFFF